MAQREDGPLTHERGEHLAGRVVAFAAAEKQHAGGFGKRLECIEIVEPSRRLGNDIGHPQLAKQVESKATPEETIQTLYRKVFARDPSRDEIALGVKYLSGAPGKNVENVAPGENVARYAQALLATNEMIFWP